MHFWAFLLASIWEGVIKESNRGQDFDIQPEVFRENPRCYFLGEMANRVGLGAIYMNRVVRAMTFATLFTITGSAFADTVNLTIASAGDPRFGDSLSVTDTSGTSTSTVAGPYPYTIQNIDNKTNPLIPDGSYTGYCIALTEDIFYGQTAQFTVTSLATDLTGETNQTLGTIQADNVLALIQDYVNADPVHNIPTNPVKSVASDALTVAIWDVVNAKSSSNPLKINSDSNNIQVSGGSNITTAVADANVWLKSLYTGQAPPTSALYAGANVYALDNSQEVQDQSIVIAFGNGHNTVPEPADVASLSSLGLIGLLIGGTFGFQRRFVFQKGLKAHTPAR
jgi:hypothetical protein